MITIYIKKKLTKTLSLFYIYILSLFPYHSILYDFSHLTPLESILTQDVFFKKKLNNVLKVSQINIQLKIQENNKIYNKRLLLGVLHD